MPLLKRDREFRLSKISYIDFKHIEMDRVLLGLFERIAQRFRRAPRDHRAMGRDAFDGHCESGQAERGSRWSEAFAWIHLSVSKS